MIIKKLNANFKSDKRNKCYIQARNFFLAAKRCGRIEKFQESGMPQVLSIPEYVNLAFSCELYIKTLLYKGNEPIKGHNLRNLFNQLDITLQNKLSDGLEIPTKEVCKLLDEHSELFSNMRYRFECCQYRESFSVPVQFFYSMVELLDQLSQETLGVKPYPSTNVGIDFIQGI